MGLGKPVGRRPLLVAVSQHFRVSETLDPGQLVLLLDDLLFEVPPAGTIRFFRIALIQQAAP